MGHVVTNEEWAAETGRPLEEIEAMIAEAEADAITAETMDPSTFRWVGDPARAKAKCEEMARRIRAGELERV